MPDLTDSILRAIGDEPVTVPVDDRTRFLRISLAVIAVIQLTMAVPALVLGDDAGLPTHVARHLGSFALALGVGLLVVAWKPERAAGVLPVIAALVVCLLASSLIDIVSGRAAPGAEVSHAPELVGLVAVWLLARTPRRPAAAGPSGARMRIRTLRRAASRSSSLALLIVGAWAAPAFAHAVLEGTEPGSGATVQRSPEDITLTFSESVEASLGAVRVFNSRASQLDVGNPEHPGGDSSVVRVSVPDLDDGTYVVTWRVLSADAHPIRGAFTFTVGESATTAKEAQSLAQRLLTDEGGELARRRAVRDRALRRLSRAGGPHRRGRLPRLGLARRS